MFNSSTQKQFWLFTDGENELERLRFEVNEKYLHEILAEAPIEERPEFLRPEEELVILRYVEEAALRFAQEFRPPMPRSVITTAMVYFKRYYLQNSVIEHIPKNVMMGCMYLACKIDEFNVSIDEFCSNLKCGTSQTNAEIILSYELDILYHLNYQLTVHTPHRPFEGFFIDIKTRFPKLSNKLEEIRSESDAFFNTANLTDVHLLYSPSQIALAAIWHCAVKLKKEIREHIENFLCQDNPEKAEKLIQRLEDIAHQINSYESPNRSTIESLMKKLTTATNWIDKNKLERKSRKRSESEFVDSDDEELLGAKPSRIK